MGDQSSHHSELLVGLSIPCDFPLDIILFTWFVQEITDGEARGETWSSVNYLVFISLIYRKNQQVRQSIV